MFGVIRLSISHRIVQLGLVLAGSVFIAEAGAEVLSGGMLGDLYRAREGGIAHYSSADLSGGNADYRPIEPGDTLVLVDHQGAGIVRRWWTTVSPRGDAEVLRNLIVRCYWDGENNPSVEVPLGDFFGMGFGETIDHVSPPLNMQSGGFNCYWPMPFYRSAKITVENRSATKVRCFYYNIDIRTCDKLPEDALYFHAQFRKTNTLADQPYRILETTGRGHYVGTLMSMQPSIGNHLGYLEGDEQIYIDGETKPSIVGTGTEDYFSSGWYYVNGVYSAPYHGVTVKDTDLGRINTYRWHIEDPIPFEKSLRFDIEHGATNNTPGTMYSSVAFWYQTHPHPPFPPLPKNLMHVSERGMPSIEAESLIDQVTVTGGELRVQDLPKRDIGWGNNAQIWWLMAKPGDELTIPITVDEAGEYELIGYFTRASSYGLIRLRLGEQQVGAYIDGYCEKVEPTGPLYLGTVKLAAGENKFVVELVGKDARSAGYGDGYLVGIDGFRLVKSKGD